jgi:hypothetical protein
VGRHLDTNWVYEAELHVLRRQAEALLKTINKELEAITESKQSA